MSYILLRRVWVLRFRCLGLALCFPFEGDSQNYKIAVSLLIADYSFERKRVLRATPPQKKKRCSPERV